MSAFMMAAIQMPFILFDRALSAELSDSLRNSTTCPILPSNSKRRATSLRGRKPTRQRSIPSVIQNAPMALSSLPLSVEKYKTNG
jgi:hypothetical protein